MIGSGAVQAGFNDPVLESQQVFTASLRALAYPGTVVELPQAGTRLGSGLGPLGPGAAALLLTLLDQDTPLWLDPSARRDEVVRWLAFNCGCPLVEEPKAALFALIQDGESLPPLELFNQGGPDNPEDSATVIIQVKGMKPGSGRILGGPGIEDRTGLAVEGLEESFWKYLRLNSRLFPQGLDFFLVGPGRLCGLPRTVAEVG